MLNKAIGFAGLISVFLLVGCGGSDSKKENSVSSSSSLTSSSAPLSSSSSTPPSSSSSSSSSSVAVTSSSQVSSAPSSSSSSTSSSSSSQAKVVLSGVAATGAAIGNAPVVAKCANGLGFAQSVTTNAQGAFSGEVNANSLPCALKVSSPSITLYSYALAAGVVNITPLTDLIIANASALDPSVWYASNNWQLVESALLLAQTNFQTIMLANGYTLPQGVFNPFNTAFIIGDLWDQLLDQLQAAIDGSVNLKSYADLLALLKDGNINALPKKITVANNSGGACSVVISANTSNALNPTIPLTQDCLSTPYTGQVNFEINEGVSPNRRNLGIDFFAPAVVGASVKLEDGYDYDLHKGAVASYVDSAGVWNADSGTVTIVSITTDSYVLSLSKVHFVVQDTTGTSKGSFTADGTITTKAPVITTGFSWKENGGTVTKTATSASYTTQYKTIMARNASASTIFEINLTGGVPGTYVLDGSNNALSYIVSSSAMFQATSGSVVITKNAALKMSGTFQATGTAAGGIATVSGTFTDIDVVP